MFVSSQRKLLDCFYFPMLFLFLSYQNFLFERTSTFLPPNCLGAHYLRWGEQWCGINGPPVSGKSFHSFPFSLTFNKHISLCYMNGISSPGCSILPYPGESSDFHGIVFNTVFTWPNPCQMSIQIWFFLPLWMNFHNRISLEMLF